jgi:hypothetical protein
VFVFISAVAVLEMSLNPTTVAPSRISVDYPWIRAHLTRDAPLSRGSEEDINIILLMLSSSFYYQPVRMNIAELCFHAIKYIGLLRRLRE